MDTHCPDCGYPLKFCWPKMVLNDREKILFATDAVMTRLFHGEKGEDIAIVASGSSTPRH